ncbi:tetraacyldisaccharide 4'-kinase [Marivirga salinae]|uniref:Tetraacyldisaccharide 4'-kinase n=1 Tax=Marivirga salinarum TaxID=3059078 RepID=A0AA51NEP1_9BACT|nr:tetraacyldisaccharide 4'-kinase [Marivirga sp. BDSF4-3]WMN13090.1 tetraacyldisaccharide 4'-kinase [Marivirga sp. BDSF4-3]
MSPFSILYKWVMQLRNHLYDIEHKAVFHFDTKIISVGNLSMGGTGKTPFVEYILRYLIEKGYSNKVATLSRGYGRKSKGFRIANDEDSPKTIGDEPFQIYQKFRKAAVVSVGEDRVLAIPSLIYEHPENEVIVLDDAYQHRSVKPNFSVLLTDFNSLFYEDYVLPSGTLRESRKGAKRADIVIVTKCPPNLGGIEQEKIKNEIVRYIDKAVFFTSVKYEKTVATKEGQEVGKKIVLVTGIAQAQKFKEHLINEGFNVVKHYDFADHHNFTSKEIEEIDGFANLENADIITTEKDWVRLICFPELPKSFQSRLFYIPIMVQFLDDEKSFHQILEDSIIRA